MDKQYTRHIISRRQFLKRLGLGASATASAALASCVGGKKMDSTGADIPADIPTDRMEYRHNPTTGDKVSLLGYGCMRWPTVEGQSARDGDSEIDQEQVNRLVDFALAHGVNYFDTSPAYCKGKSEEATGIALSRHPRANYYIATKLSNFDPSTWSREAGIKMYHESMQALRTDYIDYMLLHGIGMGAKDTNGDELTGMEAFEARYIDNGLLDFLMAERHAGRIRNLGFSYHGDIAVFDHLLALHDKYKWDFVQIQLNYVDWKHAKKINERNTDAAYLYDQLEKRGIPAVIMEPLLGGRLASMPEYAEALMKERRPDSSVASWAFRYAGTPKGVLTVLSGMTYMEHLEDNLRSFAPFEPCDADETAMLHDIADNYVESPYIPCTNCQYCMPCPFGINIPAIFAHYNKMVNEGKFAKKINDPDYRAARREYLIGYDRSVPSQRQAEHCIGCGICLSHCPQRIPIPEEMRRIDQYVEQLKQNA